MSYERKILTLEELSAERTKFGEDGRTLVMCHGCFDIVHPGHIRYLRFARSQADVLVVSVTADRFVGKGYDRPLIGEDLRAENLAALEFVDFVVVSNFPTASEVLSEVRPDVYVKGKEYEEKADARFVHEKELVESYGGRVVFSSGDVVYSSTRLAASVLDESLERNRIRTFTKRYGITREKVDTALASFQHQRILVLGDAIIDRYVFCENAQSAAESPILSITPVSEERFVGGVGLVARQIAALGSQVTLVTADEHRLSAEYSEIVGLSGVQHVRASLENRPVYEKTRYLVDTHKLLKVNEGTIAPLSSRGTQDLLAVLATEIADHDVVVISDFGYGLFGANFISEFVSLCEAQGKPILIDVSGSGASNLLKFRRAALACPTEQEIRLALGDFSNGLTNLGSQYFEHTSSRNLAITLGRRGVLLLTPSKDATQPLVAEYLPAFCRNPVDVVGAGDTFLSVMSLTLSGNLHLGVFLASVLSSLHIMQLGNSPNSLIQLRDAAHAFLE